MSDSPYSEPQETWEAGTEGEEVIQTTLSPDRQVFDPTREKIDWPEFFGDDDTPEINEEEGTVEESG